MRKRRFWFLIFALLLPVSGNAEEPEVRGVHGFSSGLPIFKGKTPEEAEKLIRSWNVNAVFASEIEPEFLQSFSRNGIQVFIDLSCFQGESHWKSHPESRPITAQGELLKKAGWYAGVCPSQEWLRKKILEKAARWAKTEGVTGIWLDFIRYPVHWEVRNPKIEPTCFCSVCLEKFQNETGLIIPKNRLSVKEKAAWILEQHKDAWTAWKCQNIAEFVRKVRERIQVENPKCLLGIFGVPWRPEEGGTHIAGQDYGLLAPHVDVLSPMLYHPLVGQPPRWVGEFVRDVSSKTQKPVWPILFTGDNKQVVPVGEIREAMKFATDAGASGILSIPFNTSAMLLHKAGGGQD